MWERHVILRERHIPCGNDMLSCSTAYSLWERHVILRERHITYVNNVLFCDSDILILKKRLLNLLEPHINLCEHTLLRERHKKYIAYGGRMGHVIFFYVVPSDSLLLPKDNISFPQVNMSFHEDKYVVPQ